MEYDASIEKSRTYLNQIREIDKMIDYKCERLDQLKAEVTCIKSPQLGADKVQSSLSGDAIPRMIAKMIDLQEEINQDIDRFVDLKAEISRNLDKIKDADAIKVLYKHYFEYKIFSDIAAEMHFCRRTVQRIHYRGLEKLSPYVT